MVVRNRYVAPGPDRQRLRNEVRNTMTINEIDVTQLAAVLDSGPDTQVTLIDVRMPDEFESERVPGAVLIPLPQLPDRIGEIPNSGTIHIICRSGNRSMTACEFLSARGYDTCNIAGGTIAWAESGRTIEGGAVT